MKCKFCDKECKNLNSLIQHQIRCNFNPDKIEFKNNFEEYNKSIIGTKRKGTNQYIKAKELGLEIPTISEETRKKLSLKAKEQKWDDDRRKKHSLSMIDAVNKNSDSYSASNVSGRTKSYDVVDSLGNKVKVKGKWELLVANFLNYLNIKWTNKIDEIISYYYNDAERRYFPDFYLIDYDVYIEVKGYQRDRDFEKWKSINNRLIILKKDEIIKIKNNDFDLIKLINKK